MERKFIFRLLTNFDYELPGVNLDVRRWSKTTEVVDLQSFDIGVYPLIDDEWSRGKAGLKIIQYQAVGIPCVASEAPLAREQIVDGQTGFLANNDQHWIEILRALIDNEQLRSSVGAAGRDAALKRYSRPVISGEYRKVIEAATKSQDGWC